jgi:hypothetical protein
MADLSPMSTDSRGLTNAQYGSGVLGTMADRKAARQKVELDGARHVVFHQRPRGEEQTVFDEFAHLESLYFGGGGGAGAGAGAGGGGGAGGSPTPSADGSRSGSAAIVALVPGQIAAEAAAAGEDLPHEDEVREIRDEVAFVQKQYLSQERAERHRFAKYYTEDEKQEHADRERAKKEVGDDAAFEFRQRLAKRVADAGMDAEDFKDGMEMHGLGEERAAEIASLTENVTKKIGYARDKETGVFKKYEGTGIPPPNEMELRIITRVLDHRAMDKRRIERVKDPSAVLEHTQWFHAAEPIPEDGDENSGDDELETLHMGGEDGFGGGGGGGGGGKRGKGHKGSPQQQQPKAAERYVLEKKPPPRAETPPNTDGRNMVCAFCGKHAPPQIDPRSTWHLQQYYDDETDRLVKDYFCEHHNFARLLLRRPAVATHVKSHLWTDLREASTLDRQHKYGRVLCYRTWLVAAAILNIIAIMLAVFFLPLLAKEQRCAALGHSASHGPFSFNVTTLDKLQIEATRGLITARVSEAGLPHDQATVTVSVHASSQRALGLVEVSQLLSYGPAAGAGGGGGEGEGFEAAAAAAAGGINGQQGGQEERLGIVSAVRPGAGAHGDVLPITMDDCYRVEIEVLLPPGLNVSESESGGLSVAIAQRWQVSECTVTREEAPWPLSLLPPRIVPPCVIGRRVPIDAPVSIDVELPGTQLAALEMSTNGGRGRGRSATESGGGGGEGGGGGTIVASAIEASVRMDVRAITGFTGSRLRTPRLAVYSLGGDIDLQSLDPPLLPSASAAPSTTAPTAVKVWLTRGEGDRQNEVGNGALSLYERDRGAIRANLTGLHHAVENEIAVHGGDADVTVRLVETTAWSAALRSCGGQLLDSAERLEGPPSLAELPLICQKFFDDRWEMCKRFAVEARARGDEHVTIEYAGNGFCEAELNLDPCYDGGDCCASTCNSRKYPTRCGMLINATTGENIPEVGYNCTDHWAYENFGDLPDCGTIMIEQHELYTAQMAVWERPLIHFPGDSGDYNREGPTLGWAGGPRSQRPQNSGEPDAQMLPAPYTSVGGSTKGWGWHTCAVEVAEIFLPQRVRIGADSPLYPRSQLSVDVVRGNVELSLAEAVGYEAAWRRHEQNEQRGLDCSIWTCDDEDECASSPCLNGASCAESDVNMITTPNSSVAVGYYNCTCTWGFCGTNCEYAKEYQKYRMIIESAGTEETNPGNYFCMAELWFQVASEQQQQEQQEYRLRGQPLMAATSATLPSFRYNNTCQATPQQPALQCLERYAFDGYANTAPCSADDSLPYAPLFLEFDTPMHLLSYSIQAPANAEDTLPYRAESGRGPHTAPSAWTLEASRDNGVTWVTLDEQTGVTWDPEEQKTFPLRTC